jgi:hypothetical protein
MSVTRLRILRMSATQRQGELGDHHAAAGRRHDLAHVPGRTKANVAAAEARG